MDRSRPKIIGIVLIVMLSLAAGFLFVSRDLYGRDVAIDWWWGGLQMWPFPLLYRILAVLLPVYLILAPARHLQKLKEFALQARDEFRPLIDNPRIGVLLGVLALWLFRSVDIRFGDSLFYVETLLPEQSFGPRGLTLRLDAPGAYLLYSWGFRYAKNLFALDAVTWFNLAGLLFSVIGIAWLWWRGKRRGWALAGGLALLFLLSGNWSQVLMGSVENYGQTTLFTLIFAVLAVESLRGREPMWKACLAYALAAFFHLKVVWLFPALLYLMIVRWNREGPEARSIALLSLLIPAFLTWGIIYFVGYDVSFWGDSAAGQGKLIPSLDPAHPYTGQYYQYDTFDPKHLAHVLSENLLMGWPGLLFLAGAIPFLKPRNVFLRPEMGFAWIFLGGALAFNLLWNPDLLFVRDQDLFSIVGLGWCLVAAIPAFEKDGEWNLPEDWRRRLLLAAIVGAILWRIPVLSFHSILAPNYLEPDVLINELPW